MSQIGRRTQEEKKILLETILRRKNDYVTARKKGKWLSAECCSPLTFSVFLCRVGKEQRCAVETSIRSSFPFSWSMFFAKYTSLFSQQRSPTCFASLCCATSFYEVQQKCRGKNKTHEPPSSHTTIFISNCNGRKIHTCVWNGTTNQKSACDSTWLGSNPFMGGFLGYSTFSLIASHSSLAYATVSTYVTPFFAQDHHTAAPGVHNAPIILIPSARTWLLHPFSHMAMCVRLWSACAYLTSLMGFLWIASLSLTLFPPPFRFVLMQCKTAQQTHFPLYSSLSF